jgi:hypothetical protein
MIKANKVDVVLRTCARTGVFNQKIVPRIVSEDRLTLIRTCIKSLIVSINNSDKEITLTVFDDHSEPADLEKIKSILAECKVPTQVFTTQVPGFNNSALEQFKYGRDHGRELVYFVEDDYLHDPQAIDLLVNAYNHFRNLSGFSEVAISPWDQPQEYDVAHAQACKIFHFHNRYWRTTISTSNTVLWPLSAVKGGWHLFETLALQYGNVAGVEEINTIGQLLNNTVHHRGPVCCFSPIPSVALHIHHLGQGSPKYIDTQMFDWQKCWDKKKSDLK